MKFLKLLSAVILIIMMVNLVSCDQLHFHKGSNGHSNDNSDKTPQTQKITYVYSVTQKILHLPECSHTQRISEDYREEYSGDISILLEKGFTICRDCLVEKVPEEEKEFVPDEDEVPFEEATFVINRTKLTIHDKECYHVDKMAEKNVKYTNLSYEELLEKEHVPCGTCMPDEYEAYKKAHPEKFPEDE